MRLYKSIIVLCSVISLSSFAQSNDKTQCNINAEYLAATYKVSTTSSSHNHREQQSKLVLWRNGQEVAHQYPQTAITESWFLSANQRLKPTRYFDEHKRAIEYQPGELADGVDRASWSQRYQLISDELLNSMALDKEVDAPCGNIQTLTRKDKSRLITVQWQPALDLIHNVTIEDDGAVTQWTLEQVNSDLSAIALFYSQREAYKATDFADIGDDHTDPFLTKMVTQGFIEKGASGFYDDQGNALEGGHGHHH